MKSLSKKIAETFGAIDDTSKGIQMSDVDLPYELDPYAKYEFVSRMSDTRLKKFKHLSTRVNKFGRNTVYLEHPISKETMEFDEKDIPSTFILKEQTTSLDKFAGLEYDTGETVNLNQPVDDLEYDIITDDDGNIKKIPRPKVEKQIQINNVVTESKVETKVENKNFDIFSKLKKQTFSINLDLELMLPNIILMKSLLENIEDEKIDINDLLGNFLDIDLIKQQIINRLEEMIKIGE